MSETTTTPGTDLEPVLQRGRIALSQGSDVKAIAKAMLPGQIEKDEAEKAVVAFPPMPKAIVLTDEVKDALAALPEVFAAVQPLDRRALSVQEMKQVQAERDVLKVVANLFAKRDEDLKEVIRTHLDVIAEDEGKADPETTPRDDSGHYVIAKAQDPDFVNVPGTNVSWSREFRAGAMTLQTDVLDALEADGSISRDVYLAMTQERRVFNENKAALAMQNPDLRDGVLLAIRKMTKIGRTGTSLFTRKAK